MDNVNSTRSAETASWVSSWLGSDRRIVAGGAGFLAVLAVGYPLLADLTENTLGVFALPPLLTAVLAGWRPTVVIGVAAFLVALVAGSSSTVETGPLLARLAVVAGAVVLAAAGAAVRERQSGRLAALDEAMSLREAFERALAPVPVPPPSFVAVARYRPADARMHIGGDFLDAVALPDERLAVLMGDVCGHGPREAAFGAALRAGWKSIALGGDPEPAEWVAALNEAFFRDGRIDTYATLCTGYLDLAAGTICFVNVGHPPPVILERPARSLALVPAAPLGLGLDDGWTSTTHPWDGTPVLLFTDGLIENPKHAGPPHRWGIDGLLRWLDRQPADLPLDTLSRALVAAATANRDIRDDVAILLVGADRTWIDDHHDVALDASHQR